MTNEQLEELLGNVVKIKETETYEQIMNAFPGPPIVEYLCHENAHLTNRVIAADKLVEALRPVLDDLLDRELPTIRETNDLSEAVTAYREARGL